MRYIDRFQIGASISARNSGHFTVEARELEPQRKVLKGTGLSVFHKSGRAECSQCSNAAYSVED